jgi:hypothetical protein
MHSPTLHSAFPRDLAAERYLDLFVVGGVSAVLAIRFILRISGYPSLGGPDFTSLTCCGAAC